MNQNTNGVNFELTDDNNRSESAAKNDIFRGTANYDFFTLMMGGLSKRKLSCTVQNWAHILNWLPYFRNS